MMQNENVHRFRLKGCAKCGGDLVVDELDWLCLQCGTYYYTNLYQRRAWAKGEDADGPLFHKEKSAESSEPAASMGLPLTPKHLAVDTATAPVSQTADLLFVRVGTGIVLGRAGE